MSSPALLAVMLSGLGQVQPGASDTASIERSPASKEATPPRSGSPTAHLTDPAEASETEDLEARFASDEATGLQSLEGPSFGRAFGEMVLVFGGVCLLAYLLLAKALPRILKIPAPAGSGRLLTIVDRLALDPRRSILVVRMGGQHFLIGDGEHGMNLLARLDSGEVQDAMDTARLEPLSSPWTGWTSLLNRRRSQKETL